MTNNEILRETLTKWAPTCVVPIAILILDWVEEIIPPEYFFDFILIIVMFLLATFGIILFHECKKKNDKKIEELNKKNKEEIEEMNKKFKKEIEKMSGKRRPPKGEKINENLTYDDVESAIKKLVEKIGNEVPDVIIGIDRGGAIVGGMLAKYLGRPLTTISSSKDWTISEFEGGPIDDGLKDSSQRTKEYKNITKVLLVDDACRSAHTMLYAKEVLEREIPDFDLRTAVILNQLRKEGPSEFRKFNPDFFAHTTETMNLRMPWDMGKGKI